jgi:hypothetical protein
MRDGNFDTLARHLAAGSSRRTMARMLLGGVAALAGLRSSASVAAPAGMADICHVDADTGTHTLITVNGNALRAHLDHGDHEPYACDEGPSCAPCVPSFVPPEVCTLGTDGVVSGDPWVVCRADAGSAWLSATMNGTYNAGAICQLLGYGRLGAYGGHGGRVCGYNDNESMIDPVGTSCSNPGSEIYDGENACEGDTLCQSVTWQCLA